MKPSIRIASGQGFWGDQLDAPKQQVENGPIDYLMLDYLAEVTMSIMQKQRARNPQFGYARDSHGKATSELMLVDEILTPDSSRFWPADRYEPGRDQQSFDKQYVRDYLETLDWDKREPGPHLPAVVIDRTRQKYLEALSRLSKSSPGSERS